MKGKFLIELPISKDLIKANLMAVSSLGEQEKEVFGVYFKNLKGYGKEAILKPTRRNFFSAGLSASLISYQETEVDDYSENALTAKLSYSYLLIPPAWDLAASCYFTLLPLRSSNGIIARFLGLNFRVGYILPFIKSPWQMHVLAGMYYTTMFVTTNSFGFRNLAGPQFFPVITRAFKNGSSMTGYFKFSPISSGFAIRSFSNRELAFGLSYALALPNKHPLSFSLDVANVHFKLDRYLGITYDSSSISFGAGYGF